MFKSMAIDASALSPVPELLRVVLENTLSQEASPESLERYLPSVCEILKNLGSELKRLQSTAAQSGKQPTDSGTGSIPLDLFNNLLRLTPQHLEDKVGRQSTASSTDNDLRKENTSPKLSNNPVRNKIQDLGTTTTVDPEIRVGHEVVISDSPVSLLFNLSPRKTLTTNFQTHLKSGSKMRLDSQSTLLSESRSLLPTSGTDGLKVRL